MIQIFSRECKHCGNVVRIKKENGKIIDISGGKIRLLRARCHTPKWVPGKSVRCYGRSPHHGWPCWKRMIINKFKEATS